MTRQQRRAQACQKGVWEPLHTRIVVYGPRSRPIL